MPSSHNWLTASINFKSQDEHGSRAQVLTFILWRTLSASIGKISLHLCFGCGSGDGCSTRSLRILSGCHKGIPKNVQGLWHLSLVFTNHLEFSLRKRVLENNFILCRDVPFINYFCMVGHAHGINHLGSQQAPLLSHALDLVPTYRVVMGYLHILHRGP